MVNHLERVFYKKPAWADFEQIFRFKPNVPFSDIAVEFLSELSSFLLKDKTAKMHSDVITFAFWCRKGAVLKYKEKYLDNMIKLGRGVVFHIAPSNVPINFAFSFAAGILSGNANIVRVPSKEFEQVDLICNAIESILSMERFEELEDSVAFIKYERDDAINKYFSINCDVRIIWGGNETIKDIRRAELPPRSYDITFADRYSLSIIDAEKYIEEQNKDALAQSFYNDTYLFDQNACTAPHLIIWSGDRKSIETAKEIFWNELHKLVKNKYDLQAMHVLNKITDVCKYAAGNEQLVIQPTEDNYIIRVNLKSLFDQIEVLNTSCGCFFEYELQSLNELAPFINRKYQTLSYYGFKKQELSSFITDNKLSGIDRIVPIGTTTDFSLTWDGYDLIEQLTRKVEVK